MKGLQFTSYIHSGQKSLPWVTLANFQTSPYLQDLLFEGSSDSAIAIIRITGNLNLANAPLLEDQLADLLHKGDNYVPQR